MIYTAKQVPATPSNPHKTRRETPPLKSPHKE